MRNYPQIYSQRNSQWASNQLGTTPNATISQYGCVLTCHAMKAGYYGHQINPAQLNDTYNKDNLYALGDLLPDSAIASVYSDISLLETKSYTNVPADLVYLKTLAQDSTKTVTVEIDFDHDPTDGIQTHFVELHDFDGTNLTIYDPWYGTDDNFATHYGTDPATTIQKIAVYRGTPVGNPNIYKGLDLTNKDSMKVAVDVWARLTAGDLVDKSKYDADIKAKDDTITNLNTQIQKALADESVLRVQIGTQTAQVLTLQKQIETLKGQLNDALKKADEYDQLEKNYKTDKVAWENYQQTANRTIAQLKNSSVAGAGIGKLISEVFVRVIRFIFRIKD